MATQLTGKIEGTRLTVLKYSHHKKHHRYTIFQCECGTIKTIRHDLVGKGSTVSCGCRLAEIKSPEHMKMMRDSPIRMENHAKALAENPHPTEGKIKIEDPPGSKNFRFVTEEELNEMFWFG